MNAFVYLSTCFFVYVLHIPKLRFQTSLPENLCNLLNASSMKIHGHAIVVPEFREFPNLADCQNFSAFEMITLAPLIYPFFRPEEQHGRSGEDEVIVPAGEEEGEVHE